MILCIFIEVVKWSDDGPTISAVIRKVHHTDEHESGIQDLLGIESDAGNFEDCLGAIGATLDELDFLDDMVEQE